LLPPLAPLQPHVQGPEPENDATDPDAHKFGLKLVNVEYDCPDAEPHTPFIILLIV
jgi:hypothetical protein